MWGRWWQDAYLACTILAVVAAVTGWDCNNDDKDGLLEELHVLCLCTFLFSLRMWFLLFKEQVVVFAVNDSEQGEWGAEKGAAATTMAALFCSGFRQGKLLHFLSTVCWLLLSEQVVNWRADDDEFKWEMIGFLGKSASLRLWSKHSWNRLLKAWHTMTNSVKLKKKNLICDAPFSLFFFADRVT